MGRAFLVAVTIFWSPTPPDYEPPKAASMECQTYRSLPLCHCSPAAWSDWVCSAGDGSGRLPPSRSVFDLTEKAPGHCPWGFVGACQNGEGVRRELHLLVAFDRRGRMDHLEMAGEGREGVGTGVAFSARRSKL